LRGVGEDVAGGAKENDGLVLSEVGVGKKCGVFRGIDAEIVIRAERADGHDAIGDGGVAKAGGGRENEDFVRGRLGEGALQRTKLE